MAIDPKKNDGKSIKESWSRKKKKEKGLTKTASENRIELTKLYTDGQKKCRIVQINQNLKK
jgi:hypothetical protein